MRSYFADYSDTKWARGMWLETAIVERCVSSYCRWHPYMILFRLPLHFFVWWKQNLKIVVRKSLGKYNLVNKSSVIVKLLDMHSSSLVCFNVRFFSSERVLLVHYISGFLILVFSCVTLKPSVINEELMTTGLTVSCIFMSVYCLICIVRASMWVGYMHAAPPYARPDMQTLCTDRVSYFPVHFSLWLSELKSLLSEPIFVNTSIHTHTHTHIDSLSSGLSKLIVFLQCNYMCTCVRVGVSNGRRH